MKHSIKIPALVENWDKVYKLLKDFIDEINVDGKVENDVLVSAEEIFVNVAKYAYPNSGGGISVDAEFHPQSGFLYLKFKDQGIPFDPTKMQSPDITQGSHERKIGGLGIFMVRKMMDGMQYFYENGSNNLLVIKKVKFD